MGIYDRDIKIERALQEILFLDVDPVMKVQQIINLGFDDETATDIVERYQIGQQAPVYYEQLPLYRHDL